MNGNSAELCFHPEATKEFDQRAQEILLTVQGIRKVQDALSQTPDLHPVATTRPEDVRSASKLVYHYDAVGENSGVSWMSADMQVGWLGDAFQPIKNLAHAMGQVKHF